MMPEDILCYRVVFAAVAVTLVLVSSVYAFSRDARPRSVRRRNI
jgi:hypothetical protein